MDRYLLVEKFKTDMSKRNRLERFLLVLDQMCNVIFWNERWKFERVYDLKFIKLSFSRGWENQEVVYGAMQGLVFWLVVFL